MYLPLFLTLPNPEASICDKAPNTTVRGQWYRSAERRAVTSPDSRRCTFEKRVTG